MIFEYYQRIIVKSQYSYIIVHKLSLLTQIHINITRSYLQLFYLTINFPERILIENKYYPFTYNLQQQKMASMINEFIKTNSDHNENPQEINLNDNRNPYQQQLNTEYIQLKKSWQQVQQNMNVFREEYPINDYLLQQSTFYQVSFQSQNNSFGIDFYKSFQKSILQQECQEPTNLSSSKQKHYYKKILPDSISKQSISLPQIKVKNVMEQLDKDGNLVVIISFAQDKGKSREFKKKEIEVDLSKSNITDQQVRAICQLLPHIRSLKLNQCPCFQRIKLKEYKELQELEIKQNNQTLIDVQLEQMSALKKLSLYLNSKLKLIKLMNCSQIADINLQGTQINDKTLLMITQQCPNLQKLDLTQCKKIKQFECLSKLKKIKELNLGWTKIMDESLNSITKQLNQLEVLHLSYCSQIKQAIQLKNCKKLKDLSLWGLNQSHDNLVELLSQQLNQLVILSLGEWKQIQFSKLNFTNCKKLSKLHLGYTEITDRDVQKLGTQIPQLEQLSLSGCKNIVNPSLINFNKIKKIDLINTSVKIQELRKKYPNMQIKNTLF